MCGQQVRKRGEILLDVDSTDDPTHGQQQLSFFNGGCGLTLGLLYRCSMSSESFSASSSPLASLPTHSFNAEPILSTANSLDVTVELASHSSLSLAFFMVPSAGLINVASATRPNIPRLAPTCVFS